MQFLKAFCIAALAASAYAQESATDIVSAFAQLSDLSALANNRAQIINSQNSYLIGMVSVLQHSIFYHLETEIDHGHLAAHGRPPADNNGGQK